MKTSIISDPGIDDLIALALEVSLSKGVSHHLISTFGNVSVDKTHANLQEFILASGVGWTLSKGSGLPVSGEVEHEWPEYFHGPDGKWNVSSGLKVQSVSGNLDTLKQADKIFSLGPLTDLKKNIYESAKEIIIMGGVFFEEGNETAYAETNFAMDADAAWRFFSSNYDGVVRVVPLDATRKVVWSRSMVENITPSSVLAKWLKDMLLAWYDNYDFSREESFCLHDPLAVWLSHFPDDAVWKTAGVEIEIVGRKRGMSFLSKNGLESEIAISMHNPELVAEKMLHAIFSKVSSKEK